MGLRFVFAKALRWLSPSRIRVSVVQRMNVFLSVTIFYRSMQRWLQTFRRIWVTYGKQNYRIEIVIKAHPSFYYVLAITYLQKERRHYYNFIINQKKDNINSHEIFLFSVQLYKYFSNKRLCLGFRFVFWQQTTICTVLLSESDIITAQTLESKSKSKQLFLFT